MKIIATNIRKTVIEEKIRINKEIDTLQRKDDMKKIADTFISSLSFTICIILMINGQLLKGMNPVEIVSVLLLGIIILVVIKILLKKNNNKEKINLLIAKRSNCDDLHKIIKLYQCGENTRIKLRKYDPCASILWYYDLQDETANDEKVLKYIEIPFTILSENTSNKEDDDNLEMVLNLDNMTYKAKEKTSGIN